MELEKEKFVGSLMFRKNGHLTISCWIVEESSFTFLKKKSILPEMKLIYTIRKEI